jgi:2,3-bisphosphoglycerate-dependent phosphoglycerate mutase
MNRLYLIRHGENPANLTKEFSHHRVDYPLTPKGVLQAQQTAEYFKDKHIDEVYSSPLRRAVETAQIIAASLGQETLVMEFFREVNTGNLEGQPPTAELWAFHDEIINDWYAGQRDRRFPEGENSYELWERLKGGILQITAGKEDRNLIIVAHGGIFSFPIHELCPDVDKEWLRSQESHNCSISEVLISQMNGQIYGRLVSWARCDHLSGEAAQLVPGIARPEHFDLQGRLAK